VNVVSYLVRVDSAGCPGEADVAREEIDGQFRNSCNARIAVTVDMSATGTDVKALECLARTLSSSAC
jgi:type I site-specific restriction endonuclease